MINVDKSNLLQSEFPIKSRFRLRGIFGFSENRSRGRIGGSLFRKGHYIGNVDNNPDFPDLPNEGSLFRDMMTGH